MHYFSYGSNMSLKRLRTRAPSAKFVTVAILAKHELRFHKVGKDGSGKCNATSIEDMEISMIGVVYEIDKSGKTVLDQKEGLGYGYDEKIVVVTTTEGNSLTAFTYYATNINPLLKPFHWYKEHVIRGAKENVLPEHYVQAIADVESVHDHNTERHETEIAIYR